MTILGDHQGVGVANLTEANQDKFAEILAWAVEEYQLDGIDFDDDGRNTVKTQFPLFGVRFVQRSHCETS